MFHLGRSHSSGLPDGSPSVGLDLHCLQDRRTPSGALVTNHSQATAASDHTSALQGDQCVIVALSEILVRASFVLGSLRALCPGLLGAISNCSCGRWGSHNRVRPLFVNRASYPSPDRKICTFSAFWLRSSVVSVLISLISGMGTPSPRY